MKYIIDTDVCKNNNLTLEETLMLYILANEKKPQDILNQLLAKGFAFKDMFEDGSYLVNGSSIKETLNNIIVDSASLLQGQSDTRFENLAVKLREIYIPGKKVGTQDYFKGSTPEIKQRLKKFIVEYGDFTDEQIIEATEKYVKSFNGDYQFAQLLKYFISKKVDGEKGSRLLNYIVNAEDEVKNEIDWETTLK